jgi:hypothetical protein
LVKIYMRVFSTLLKTYRKSRQEFIA